MKTKRQRRIRYTCPYCGRFWEADTKTQPSDSSGWIGFLRSAVTAHNAICKKRTPQERWKKNKQDERRWAKRPPKHTIIILNYNHPGVKKPD